MKPLKAGLGTAVGVTLLTLVSAAAAQPAPSSIGSTQQSGSIQGVVLNANTNQPIGRALVQVDRQSILTGHDGKFEFAGLDGTAVTVKVTKPGFYESQDAYQPVFTSVPVGSTDEVQIRLYPEAILAGTLTAANGDPLPQIFVQALRRIDDETGDRWIMGAQTMTNADGEFRLPLPGGDYVIETHYSQPRPGIRLAVLPAVFPASAANAASAAAASTIHLASGSEQHLELHPPTRPNHSVHVRIDGMEGGAAGQSFPQVQARLPNGIGFYPFTRGEGKPGEVVVNLPSGSYVLSATASGRENDTIYGETKVTVTDADVTGVSIHLQAAAELTVEATVDRSATSANSVVSDTALERKLGIYMEKTDTGINLGGGNVSPNPRPGGVFSFSLLPGTYRLRSTNFSSWYIESATVGGSDLLTKELVVDGGGSSLPLRLVAGNATATLKGTVKLAGTLAGGYVYLLATNPTTSPIIAVRSGQDGSFTRSLLPPGSYRVLASENRSFFDLTDPAIQSHFASYIQTVTVGSGETANVDLTAVPTAEWKP